MDKKKVNKPGFDTIALHGGQKVDRDTGSRAVPIYQTTSYLFNDTTHAADLFALKKAGNIYTRMMNPTWAVLEERIAALEGGIGGMVTASGQAAETLVALNLATVGDHIVSSSSVYGGTHTLFHYTLPKFGIRTTFVDSSDPENFRRAITPRTKMLYAETIPNPGLNTPDIQALAKVAHSAGIPLVIDNTVATPYLCRPFEWGADIVIHSLTKWLGGHGTSIGGIIVDSGRFDWANGNFPGFTEPDPSYHGLIFQRAFGKNAFLAKARVQLLRDLGPALSPFNAFLILLGVETLSLRVRRHCENAMTAARFLKRHRRVAWVNYPGLPGHPTHTLARKYLKGGFGSMIGFGVKGGYRAAVRFIGKVKLLSHLANIGDAKSLVIHPASTTQSQLTPAERKAAGATEDYIRLSVGIEDVADIIADIDRAL